ncbi:carbonate dehydratase [Bacillus sp. FJAT-27251]|uniref:carbonate dehydratase n=1 Tax=Bacillus sp. FJAT-27251 TaxID=1684142 RepID=UPI0006A7D890|nr:carbonate dehydratase [Bacillus sp. FJAT-27251]
MRSYPYFIGPNPKTTLNHPVYPQVSTQAFLSPFSCVIGDVTIRRNVFVAPFVSIRADEGTPFYIGENTNLQDGVILHGLANEFVEAGGRRYSIYVGQGVSCTHGSLIHGPCLIEDGVFIGFQSIVIRARVGKGSYIGANAVITGGVTLRPCSFVPPGASIDTQRKADSLASVPIDEAEFAKQVQRVNTEFPAAYILMFGKKQCSCGLMA